MIRIKQHHGLLNNGLLTQPKQHLKLNSWKKLSNAEFELKKALLIKKACNSIHSKILIINSTNTSKGLSLNRIRTNLWKSKLFQSMYVLWLI